nr:hypothetical protein [Tanacetum cinerariifolium]
MAFKGNTRHLGSFGEETDEITDLHQILEEVLRTTHGEDITGITRRRRDPSSDGVRDLVTASGRSRLNEDPESSTLAVDANSNCMERQMLIHFHRERDANCADAQDLMRLIVEVEERMNHNDALIREVEILTGCIPVVEATRASAGSKTLIVPTKRPHPIRNCILRLASMSTYAKILYKDFGIRNPKDDVAASADVSMKGNMKIV